MANTYTWTATNLIGYPQYEGQTDVITTVFYTVVADDGAGHTANISSIQQTPLDPLVPFIPYPDLTNDIVIGWVQYNIGPDMIASIQGSLAIQVERQIDPPPQPEVLPLPWPTPEPPQVERSVPVVEPVAEPVVVAETEVIVETSEPTN